MEGPAPLRGAIAACSPPVAWDQPAEEITRVARSRLRQRPVDRRGLMGRLWGCRGGGRVTGEGWRHGQETGSGQPALRQALQARGTDLDLIRELPSGPAACEPHQRPHTCQHPTARCTNPENLLAPKRASTHVAKFWRLPRVE